MQYNLWYILDNLYHGHVQLYLPDKDWPGVGPTPPGNIKRLNLSHKRLRRKHDLPIIYLSAQRQNDFFAIRIWECRSCISRIWGYCSKFGGKSVKSSGSEF